MTCVENQEQLTALLHHELQLPDEQAVRDHLLGCEACREQHHKILSVMRLIRQFVPIEPSARARRELQERIEDVISRDKRPDSQRRGEVAAPQWRLVSPTPPPALTYEPPKALPSPAPDHKPEVVALSPSARAISTRLENSGRVQRRSRALRAMFWLSLLCAAVTAGLGGYMLYQQHSPAPNPQVRNVRLAAHRRLEDRQAANVRGKRADTLISTQVQLGSMVGEDEELRVVPHYDASSGEICLIVYRDADIQRITSNERIDRAAFAALLQGAIQVTAIDGKFSLPRELVTQYIGLDHKAAIFSLDNRIEIWSAPRLAKYMAGEADMSLKGVPVANGLPTELF